jgi:hypothetical protein
MNDYNRIRFGDPCRTCGFDWSTDSEACRQILGGATARFSALMSEHAGPERYDGLEWNAQAYVSHVAEGMRIWAERVAAVALGAIEPIVPYDESVLGEVRGYEGLPLQGALWSLGRASGDWQAAEALADSTDLMLDHPEQGPIGLSEVRRIVAHDVEHHAFDLSIILNG